MLHKPLFSEDELANHWKAEVIGILLPPRHRLWLAIQIEMGYPTPIPLRHELRSVVTGTRAWAGSHIPNKQVE